MNYEINFTIPRGDTGPTGPAGTTAAGLKAYGGAYNDVSQSITVDPSEPAYLSLPKEMPSLNILYNLGAETIYIQQDGIYEIAYGCVYYTNVAAAAAKTCTLSVRVNNVDIPGALIPNIIKNYDTNSSTVFGSINNTVIAKLKNGDNITLRFGSTSGGDIYFPNDVNSIITLKRIDWIKSKIIYKNL